jgi:transketolase
LPADLAARLADGLAGVAEATRKHSGTVIGRLAAATPALAGGSADLAESDLTRIEGAGDVGPAAGEGADPFAGRNLHFGIREHAMAAITNGIALDGTFLPYAGTFLIFSDYMRPSLRLAALMRARSTFVFTHDTIFLGEDGPTHQPIEHLDALRAIPGFTVFRPADGVETALAWAFAAQRARGPVAIVLTRQKLAAIARPAGFRLEDVWRGGHAVRECAAPDVVLVATGSEVVLACAAADLLAAQDRAVRVVSLPCLELFLEQPEAWRRELVPGHRVPVVAVEAARGGSLFPVVGSRGLVYGLGRFGASAPFGALAEEFGFTPDALAAAVRGHLEKAAAS